MKTSHKFSQVGYSIAKPLTVSERQAFEQISKLLFSDELPFPQGQYGFL